MASRALFDRQVQELRATQEEEMQSLERSAAEAQDQARDAFEAQRRLDDLSRAYEDLEREFWAGRECMNQLLQATARIGHFTFPLGPGARPDAGRQNYEAIGKAWQRLHKFLHSKSAPSSARHERAASLQQGYNDIDAFATSCTPLASPLSSDVPGTGRGRTGHRGHTPVP